MVHGYSQKKLVVGYSSFPTWGKKFENVVDHYHVTCLGQTRYMTNDPLEYFHDFSYETVHGLRIEHVPCGLVRIYDNSLTKF